MSRIYEVPALLIKVQIQPLQLSRSMLPEINQHAWRTWVAGVDRVCKQGPVQVSLCALRVERTQRRHRSFHPSPFPPRCVVARANPDRRVWISYWRSDKLRSASHGTVFGAVGALFAHSTAPPAEIARRLSRGACLVETTRPHASKISCTQCLGS